jgi:hypothetical protein
MAIKKILLELPLKEDKTNAREIVSQFELLNTATIQQLKFPDYSKSMFVPVFPDAKNNWDKVLYVVLMAWYDSPLKDKDWEQRREEALKFMGIDLETNRAMANFYDSTSYTYLVNFLECQMHIAYKHINTMSRLLSKLEDALHDALMKADVLDKKEIPANLKIAMEYVPVVSKMHSELYDTHKGAIFSVKQGKVEALNEIPNPSLGSGIGVANDFLI